MTLFDTGVLDGHIAVGSHIDATQGAYTYVFFLMIRRPPRSTLDRSSAASDVYKRQSQPDPGGIRSCADASQR